MRPVPAQTKVADMSIDLSQFYQVFFEEAAEHLATMEALLLELDVAAPSMDDLNAIFRSAHSIKGGAGTFGFNDMTEVTHVLENLLDRLRKEEMKLTDEMVSTFLEAGDVIHMQLDAHRGEGEVDQQQVHAICARLTQLTQGERAPVAAASQPVQEEYGFFDTAPAQEAVDGGDAYGFFDDVPSAAPTEAYGFFGEAPTAAPTEDYGFFDAVPEPEKAETAYGFFDGPHAVAGEPAIAASADSAPADPASSFGFFADEPAQQFPTSPQQAQQEAIQGYGFFQKVQPPAESSASAQSTVVDTTAPARRASDQGEAVPRGRRAGDKASAGAATDTSIRVSVEKVDQLINLVGELVITQAMLAQSAIETDDVVFERMQAGLRQLERNTRDLQEVVMSVRMLPISFVFSRFPRVVRDVAGKLGKQVELKTLGESTELDKGLIEKIADPLTHLVRNSLDHGIESPEKREAAGKPAKGTVTLNAFHQGGNIVIEVSDDGGGLSRSKIMGKARERGFSVRDDMPDQDVWALIFEAGFSTAEVITDVSGRGVGMDVVKRNISSLGGRIEINSVEGYGTRMSIRLPLTLAILDGLSVAVGPQVYIIPLAYIVESLQLAEGDLRTVSGGRMVHVRGEYLPLVPLRERFNVRQQGGTDGPGIVVIIEAEGQKSALLVDELLGQHQVVIKSLETNFRKLPGISGATIMGDGKVALILDVAALDAVQD